MKKKTRQHDPPTVHSSVATNSKDTEVDEMPSKELQRMGLA
jgi:hypothetical protein